MEEPDHSQDEPCEEFLGRNIFLAFSLVKKPFAAGAANDEAWSVSPSERQPVARCPTTMDGECRLVIVQKRHGIRQSLSYCQTCQLAERLRTP
jgi:hypothetical protein